MNLLSPFILCKAQHWICLWKIYISIIVAKVRYGEVFLKDKVKLEETKVLEEDGYLSLEMNGIDNLGAIELKDEEMIEDLSRIEEFSFINLNAELVDYVVINLKEKLHNKKILKIVWVFCHFVQRNSKKKENCVRDWRKFGGTHDGSSQTNSHPLSPCPTSQL